MGLEVGTVCEGKITSITKYGAFVSLEGGKSGMVHISEISDKFIRHPSEVLTVGQIVNVRVKEVDVKKKRIGLTMKTKK
jgi:uncharacterized protein